MTNWQQLLTESLCNTKKKNTLCSSLSLSGSQSRSTEDFIDSLVGQWVRDTDPLTHVTHPDLSSVDPFDPWPTDSLSALMYTGLAKRLSYSIKGIDTYRIGLTFNNHDVIVGCIRSKHARYFGGPASPSMDFLSYAPRQRAESTYSHLQRWYPHVPSPVIVRVWLRAYAACSDIDVDASDARHAEAWCYPWTHGAKVPENESSRERKFSIWTFRLRSP